MTTREKVEAQKIPGLLNPDFDDALLGWAERKDLPARPAYSLERLVVPAVATWGEGECVEFIRKQQQALWPDVVLVEMVPARAAFWDLARKGMIVWDQLNAAVCGIATLRGLHCTIYDRERSISELISAFEDSDSKEDITEAMTKFFELNIAGATLGERTPLLLTGGNAPFNNGLGYERGRQTATALPEQETTENENASDKHPAAPDPVAGEVA